MNVWCVILGLLIALHVSFAQDGSLLPTIDESLTSDQPTNDASMRVFLEGQDMRKLSNMSLEIIISDSEHEFKLLRYVRKGYFDVFKLSGEYQLLIKADDVQNEKLYYYRGSLNTEEGDTHTAVLLPASSVSGFVYDKQGNIIRNAQIKFECIKTYGDTDSIYTGQSGSYLKKYLPMGECNIYAVSGDQVGVKKIILSEQHHDVEISLSKTLGEEGLKDVLIGSVLAILVIALVAFLGRRIGIKTRSKQILESIKEKEKRVIRPSRIRDLTKTLNSSESKVVDHLLDVGECYQNKLVYATGVPKTSMARILQALEAKKIIACEKHGKVKKVKLTDWALEKTE